MARKTRTIHELEAVFAAAADALEKDMKRLVADIVINVATELAKRTPVDTAYARSNWNTSLTPVTGTLMPYKMYPSRYRRNRRGNLGKGGKFTERVNTWGVTQQAQSAMIAWELDKPVYVVNNVPYVPYLDEGRSPQAPAGFVRAAVQYGKEKAIKQFRFVNLRKLNPRRTRKTL